MPLVPLYDENASPESSHHVRSPGGYETWRIRAYDEKQNLFLSASLWNGYLFHPTYQKRYHAYLRHPTRTAPPVPENYACQHLALYQNNRLLASTLNPLPPIQSFPIIPPSGLRLSLGSCHLDLIPQSSSDPFRQETWTANHHWILSNPFLKVHGQLELAALPGKLTINAIAVHDHRFGPTPIGSRYSPSWLDGCALFPTTSLLFQGTTTTSWLIETSLSSPQLVNHPIENLSPTRGPWLIRYPRTISLADRATLTNPKIIHSSPIHLHILYDAKSSTESGRAFCEISHPRRLHWPLINLFLPRPRCGPPPITWQASSPPPPPPAPATPTDKLSPSAP